MTRRARLLSGVAYLDLLVAALARAIRALGRVRRVAARTSPVRIDRRRQERRLLAVTRRADLRSRRELVRPVARRARVVRRQRRRRDALMARRARRERRAPRLVRAMAIETILAAAVRGMHPRALVVATLTIGRLDGRLAVRVMALLAVDRSVLNDRLARLLLFAMTIHT
jgi:hypothetical protein